MEKEAQRIKEQLEKELNEKLEIALFGQSGAGKSSIINKIIGEKVAQTGVETNKTLTAKKYEKDGLIFIDLPGYGTKEFKGDRYIDEFGLENVDLFLYVVNASAKLSEDDVDLFNELKRMNKTVIIIVNKTDQLWEDGVSLEELKKRKTVDIAKQLGLSYEVDSEMLTSNSALLALGAMIGTTLFNNSLAGMGLAALISNLTKNKTDENNYANEKKENELKNYGIMIIFTSCKDNSGFDELYEAIELNLDNAKREKFARRAKILSEKVLNQKREVGKDIVDKYSWLAAGNALNPIPGVNVAVDLGILLRMFNEIKEMYGLDDEELKKIETIVEVSNPILASMIKNVLEWSTKEGLMLLLKNVATKVAVVNTAKYIPILGTMVAAGAGYGIAQYAGNEYLDKCHQIAKTFLEENIKYEK